MKINRHTKVSTLIKENNETISALADLTPTFEKLKNPILRNEMASGMTIEMAAQTAGISTDQIFEALLKINFEIEPNQTTDQEEIDIVRKKATIHNSEGFEKIFSKYDNDHLKKIDVRLLEKPGYIQAILAELSLLPKGDALLVYHYRFPVYVLEELSDKDYEIHLHFINSNNIHMLIIKK
ncbi:MAG TPA: DUF1858 domain-containing protein [Niabella sp.]|nr:DUF1858 domain-containing protein [Chitinophagaceae bacterium]HRN48729.1 DUF1858 domain-containing protein [Niabella sp.]HRO83346.1 DUF1858 domain-containing protein [Niabella sp.]HUN03588.1 DUF1858 domain-containing protein [Niabella sp.]